MCFYLSEIQSWWIQSFPGQDLLFSSPSASGESTPAPVFHELVELHLIADVFHSWWWEGLVACCSAGICSCQSVPVPRDITHCHQSVPRVILVHDVVCGHLIAHAVICGRSEYKQTEESGAISSDFDGVLVFRSLVHSFQTLLGKHCISVIIVENKAGFCTQ